MDTLAFVLSLFLLPILLVGSLFLFRGTVLDVSHLRPNPWPLILYMDFFLVLLPLPVVSYYGVERIPVLFVARSGIELAVVLYTILTLALYITTLGLLLRFLKFHAVHGTRFLSAPERVEKLALGMALYGVMLLVLFLAFGYQHAVLGVFFSGKTLLQIRLENAYQSGVPSQLASLLPLTGYLLAALGGYVAREKRGKGVLFLLLALFLLSAPGDKAPVVWGVIIWLFSEASLLPRKFFSLRTVVLAVFLLLAFAPLLYGLVLLQNPGFTLADFSLYLFGRLVVGQMAGVYETFGLADLGIFPEGDFYWHVFPGAKWFVDYLDYQKVLMMVTEGYDVTEMGVKNTYFIAEAFAIGGIPLVLLSPFFVALSTFLGLLFLSKLFNKLFVDPQVAQGLTLLVYFKTHSITGGFSSYPLLKGIILVAFQLALILIPTWAISKTLEVFANTLRLVKAHVTSSPPPR